MLSSISKGQPVKNTCNGKSGIVVAVAQNDFTGQQILTVRVPGYPVTVIWNEACVAPVASADALVVGDMVIAFDHAGDRHMGQIVGKTDDGHIAARFAAGVFKVTTDRIWRAWPMQNVAVAS
jgi:hypothetical protein